MLPKFASCIAIATPGRDNLIFFGIMHNKQQSADIEYFNLSMLQTGFGFRPQLSLIKCRQCVEEVTCLSTFDLLCNRKVNVKSFI